MTSQRLRGGSERRFIGSGSRVGLAGILTGVFAGLMSFAGAGCANPPTVLVLNITAEATVAPLLLLSTLVVSQGDPSKPYRSSYASVARGNASDRPAPYQFPLEMAFAVPAALAGPVTVTIEGRDWDSYKVIARGTAPATVLKEQRSPVSVVTLSVVIATDSDGGTSDGAADAGTAAVDAVAEVQSDSASPAGE